MAQSASLPAEQGVPLHSQDGALPGAVVIEPTTHMRQAYKLTVRFEGDAWYDDRDSEGQC